MENTAEYYAAAAGAVLFSYLPKALLEARSFEVGVDHDDDGTRGGPPPGEVRRHRQPPDHRHAHRPPPFGALPAVEKLELAEIERQPRGERATLKAATSGPS